MENRIPLFIVLFVKYVIVCVCIYQTNLNAVLPFYNLFGKMINYQIYPILCVCLYLLN